jgi:hypothetical protein
VSGVHESVVHGSRSAPVLINLVEMVEFVMEHSKSRAAGALRGRRRERRGAARARVGVLGASQLLLCIHGAPQGP